MFFTDTDQSPSSPEYRSIYSSTAETARDAISSAMLSRCSCAFERIVSTDRPSELLQANRTLPLTLTRCVELHISTLTESRNMSPYPHEPR